MERNDINRAVMSPFWAAGWKKKGKQTVYRVGDGVGVVVRVSAARFVMCQHVDVGLWFSGDGPSYVPHYQCPVNFRVDALFVDERSQLRAACNLETTSDEQLAWLTDFFDNFVEPKLCSLTSIEALRELVRSPLSSGMMVFASARESLGCELD